jgi:hypothetical protein
VKAGKTLNFTAFNERFMPRYKRWQARRSDAITLEDVSGVLQPDTPIWVKPKGGAATGNRKVEVYHR